MTAENFVYWLQGFFELKEYDGTIGQLSPNQVRIIKDHLNLVLNKQTPTYNLPSSPSQQPVDLTHTKIHVTC